jgi:hypothetical protein
VKLLSDLWSRIRGPQDSEESTSSNTEYESSPLMELLPYLLLTGLASITVALLIVKFMPASSTAHIGGYEVVTFDIIKYANAQRAVASKFLGKEGAQEAAPILMEVSKKTRETIESVAGPGTIIVVRQAVVYGAYRDITDDVLIQLGLPTDVPTQDPTTYAVDFAPTMMSVERAQRDAAKFNQQATNPAQTSSANPVLP